VYRPELGIVLNRKGAAWATPARLAASVHAVSLSDVVGTYLGQNEHNAHQTFEIAAGTCRAFWRTCGGPGCGDGEPVSTTGSWCVTEAEKALATAQNLVGQRRWQDALQTLVPALGSADTAYQALCLRAQVLLVTRPQQVADRAGQESGVEQARADVGHALAIWPQGEWAHRLMASIFLVDGRTGAALAEAEEAARLQPDAALALYALSECQIKAFRQHDALRTAQAAVAAHPHDPVAYQAMVKAARSLSRWDDAEGACQAGLRLEPQNEDLLLDLAEIRYHQQRYLEAAEAYLAIARISPVSDAPVKALVQISRQLYAAGSTWQAGAPDSGSWDGMCQECPAPVDEACREFWRVTLEARDRVLQSLTQLQEIIQATVRSLGGTVNPGTFTPRSVSRWSGAAFVREPFHRLDWQVLGFEEAPVRGDPQRINTGAGMLKHAGERTAELGQQFAPLAAATTGLHVISDDGADFYQIVKSIHAEVTSLTLAYQSGAAALSQFGDALKWAQRQTSDARGWAERAVKRRQQAEDPELHVQHEWEQERLAAVQSGKTALATLSEAEARCAEVVRAAISHQPEGVLRAG
jgi:tetratricopeptide (TPR) repeat protein